MSDEIEFGEIQEVPPQKGIRPDCNRHFAVVPYGQPVAGDLPIYVDWDSLCDMELHAQTDTSVELGGVLLGGQYEDEAGNPFVVISDSLRAAHYESTKGSFKFTHDTWSAIGREREDFSPELQMVGWYHTHPDWGVFLSGMDMFICDNFFNKQLDVALVIDPCRGDRGMFQWLVGDRHETRRTGGFYITASRFREAELKAAVEQLQVEGKIDFMATNRQTPTGYGPAPNIYLPHQAPPPRGPSFTEVGILGMVAMQFCLLLLVAVKLISPPPEPAVAASAKTETTSKRADLAQEAAQVKIEKEVVARLLTSLHGAPTDYAANLKHELAENQALQDNVPRYVAREKELMAKNEDLSTSVALLESQVVDLQAKQKDIEEKLAEAKKRSAKSTAIAAEKSAAGDPDETSAAASWGQRLIGQPILLGLLALLAACTFVTGVWVFRAPAPAEPPPLGPTSNGNSSAGRSKKEGEKPRAAADLSQEPRPPSE